MRKFFVLMSLAVAGIGLSNPAAAAVQSCISGAGGDIAAVTQTTPITISAKWQSPAGSMQKILSKTVTVGGLPLIPGCMVAHFSTMARITDNYVVFRVTVDGVPMNGHAIAPGVGQPAVWVAISTQDEQLTDPTRTASFNFFANVLPGNHTVDVWAAGGSNIVTPPGGPVLFNPVLTLEYK